MIKPDSGWRAPCQGLAASPAWGAPGPLRAGEAPASPSLEGSEGAGVGPGARTGRQVQGLAPGEGAWPLPQGCPPSRSKPGQGGSLTCPPSPQCSAPCGGGMQRRLVQCVNTQTGLPEEDSEQCSHEARPETSRPCGTQDCELTEAPRESVAPCRGSGQGGQRETGSSNCQPTTPADPGL